MKRWIFSFPVFPIALLTGLFAFHITNSQESHIDVFTVQAPARDEQEYFAPPIDSSTVHSRDENEFSESFTNSSHIGRRGKNKVEIHCFDRGNGMIAEIKFYSRSRHGDWEQKQSFEFDKDTLTPCEPKVEDFNNDGLKDLTYISSVAARGSNEVRTLFIYDKAEDKLVHIKNSERFPNIGFNKKLKCIDAWLFHGATTTVFLKLEGDTLQEFASVDTGLDRVVTVTDKDGKSRVLSRKKMHEDDIYTRYSDYDPPTP